MITAAAHEAVTRAALLQHGRDWAGEDVTGWHASEKLDGCRAWWDGAALYTRSGLPIRGAEHITCTLPRGTPLDGEIWAGRGQFETARLAVQHGRFTPEVRFVAFDAPATAGAGTCDWLERLQLIEHLQVNHVHAFEVRNLADLRHQLHILHEAGGEGYVLRRPGLRYTPGRTGALLKFKAAELYAPLA